MEEAGVGGADFQTWTAGILKSDIAAAKYFQENADHMRAVIDALLGMKAEADSGTPDVQAGAKALAGGGRGDAKTSSAHETQAKAAPTPPDLAGDASPPRRRRSPPTEAHSSTHDARLTRERLLAMSQQEVADSATARAGVQPAAACVEAVKEAGFVGADFQTWTAETVYYSFATLPSLPRNCNLSSSLIAAIIITTAEASMCTQSAIMRRLEC